MLKSGGTLVYAVCSLEPQEGEAIIAAFLASHPGFAIQPPMPGELPDGVTPTAEGWVRVLPGTLADKGGLDGFFVARLARA
jgi:16S rRNA (cytosine967-C5)-methyltransferase